MSTCPIFARNFIAAVALVGCATTVAAPKVARADGPPPATASAPEPQGTDVERARVHYDRGIQLYNEENYDAALYEFERAYEQAPSYKILYNMARIQRQQNNYAASLLNFRRYLTEGAANVPEDRRKEVEKDIELLKPRVATIDIKVNVDGADIYLDDSPVCTGVQTGCVGKSPLPGPVTVNPGRRRITAQKTGYQPASTTVRVVGSDAVSAKIDMVENGKTIIRGTDWRPVVGWTVTGALAISAGVTGYLALKASNDLKDLEKTRNPDQGGTIRQQLDDQHTKMKTFAIVTDVLGACTIVAAGVSAYLTWLMPKDVASKDETRPPARAADVRFTLTPGGGAVVGSF